MTYKAVTEWLFDQIPNYQLQGNSAYKPGLENIRDFLKHLGNPQKDVKFVHVAGTNGKGSVSHILASVLIENNYRTGLFTSPHIHDFRERIKIDGQLVSEDFVVQFVEDNKSYIETKALSFFEITAALAFTAFAKMKCDIAIIETGLGGRLDATNVIIPEVSVITNIGIEHVEFLGDTLEKIAFEKAGIIKQNVPVVIGELQDQTYPVFEKVAQDKKSELYLADYRSDFKSDLSGSFQQKNISTAVKTIEILQKRGWNLEDVKTTSALLHVYRNTGFSARMQTISESPKVIIDVAHNAEGVESLMNEIERLDYKNLFVVYGSSNDKDTRRIGALLPKKASYYLTTFNSKRSLTTAQLDQFGTDFQLKHKVFQNPYQALEKAKSNAQSDDLILVFGSFYLLDDILAANQG